MRLAPHFPTYVFAPFVAFEVTRLTNSNDTTMSSPAEARILEILKTVDPTQDHLPDEVRYLFCFIYMR